MPAQNVLLHLFELKEDTMTIFEYKEEVLKSTLPKHVKKLLLSAIDMAGSLEFQRGFKLGQRSITEPLNAVQRIMSGEKVVGHSIVPCDTCGSPAGDCREGAARP